MKRILIVDDSAANREYLKTIAEHAGFAVIEASDGCQAVDLASETLPDLIIMDIQMPRLDGYGALQALRATPALASVPVIAVTASAMNEERERGRQAGFHAYLTKPVGVRELRLLLRTILEGVDREGAERRDEYA